MCCMRCMKHCNCKLIVSISEKTSIGYFHDLQRLKTRMFCTFLDLSMYLLTEIQPYGSKWVSQMDHILKSHIVFRFNKTYHFRKIGKETIWSLFVSCSLICLCKNISVEEAIWNEAKSFFDAKTYFRKTLLKWITTRIDTSISSFF